MAKHTEDMINEILILKKKMDSLFQECMNDSMTCPLLWFRYQDSSDKTTLARLNQGLFRPNELIQRGHALSRMRKEAYIFFWKGSQMDNLSYVDPILQLGLHSAHNSCCFQHDILS
jgi:hypothetical protein